MILDLLICLIINNIFFRGLSMALKFWRICLRHIGQSRHIRYCLGFGSGRGWGLVRATCPWLNIYYTYKYINQCLASWRFQPMWKMLVKLDHFPNFRAETKIFETTTQLVSAIETWYGWPCPTETHPWESMKASFVFFHRETQTHLILRTPQAPPVLKESLKLNFPEGHCKQPGVALTQITNLRTKNAPIQNVPFEAPLGPAGVDDLPPSTGGCWPLKQDRFTWNDWMLFYETIGELRRRACSRNHRWICRQELG